MITNEHVDRLSSATVYDTSGDKIGKVGQVYLDDQTGQPNWITVNTGLFGKQETFVPVQDATFDGGDRIDVRYSKDKIKDAPKVDADHHVEESEEETLYQYYGLTHGSASSMDDDSQSRGGETNGDAMTRSEERVSAGTERVATGRARLRKYVTTEQQTITVPVEREEVRLEREPITEANRDQAMSGPDITEDEHEVTLTQERPVVTKEAVPVERVSLGKETVTDEETVSEDVRKEQIDLDADSGVQAGRSQR